MQLSKRLCISYPTSWYMPHRLRVACNRDTQNKLDSLYQGKVGKVTTYRELVR